MFYKLNFRVIFQLLGVLLTFNGALMFLAVGMSWLTQDQSTLPLLKASVGVLLVGILLLIIFRGVQPQIQKRVRLYPRAPGRVVCDATVQTWWKCRDTNPSIS